MSDREVLKLFSRQPVSQEMVAFLVSTTNSIIQVKSTLKTTSATNGSGTTWSVTPKVTSLTKFINNLIQYSNVQTPTLMASLIYLNKLRNHLPANAVGMETTRHRIFLAALILSAKTLNDSSPLNKHWTKYTDGLLSLEDVNMAERELIGLLKWDITVKQEDLLIVLQPFLTNIQQSLARKQQVESAKKSDYYRLSNTLSNRFRVGSSNSLASSSSTASLASSNLSLRSAGSNYSLSEVEEEQSYQTSGSHSKRHPLASRSASSLNRQNENKLKNCHVSLSHSHNLHSGRVLA
ncbi:PHO85 cyclin-2 [[Candida] anglica]|uniref:PHO85 cyclin-2 n=1 Tax=[Candida] anglica TaxID=148631 RepID=A0ABP0E8T2_9ASCO